MSNPAGHGRSKGPGFAAVRRPGGRPCRSVPGDRHERAARHLSPRRPRCSRSARPFRPVALPGVPRRRPGRRTCRPAPAPSGFRRRARRQAGRSRTRSGQRRVRCLLRPSAGTGGDHRRRRRHLPPAAARPGTDRRAPLRGERVRPRAARTDPRRPGRGRPVLRPPGPPGRRRHRADLGRTRPLHGTHRAQLAGRLLLDTPRRRWHRGGRGLGNRTDQAPGTRGSLGHPHRLWQPTAGSAGRGDAPTGLTTLPPLLRGYLRLGAWVCGAPAYDPDFNVADLYVLLSLRRTDPRYLRHFLALAPLR